MTSRPNRPRALSVLALLASMALASSAAPALAAPPSAGPDVIALPDGFGTEGVTSAPDGTFYATSLRGAGVATGSLREGTSETLVELPGTSLRGAVIDPATGYVWIAGARGETGIVLVLDPDAAQPVLQETELPGAVFPNDLTLVDGGVVVTDSSRDVLYQVQAGDDGTPASVSELALSGDWDPVEDDPAGTLAANGIRTLSDGSLLVVDSRDGGLYAVDPSTGAADRLVVRGRALTGGDGLVLDGSRLFVVRGRTENAVEQVLLRDTVRGWVAVTQRSLTDPDLQVPSTATLDEGDLWAVNAQFGLPDQTFEVVRVTR